MFCLFINYTERCGSDIHWWSQEQQSIKTLTLI